MSYEVRLVRSAQKDIKSIDRQIALRIQKKIQFFLDSQDPLSFAEPLTKPSDAQYRWRVGNYRALFDVDQATIIILRVQHRREVYKK